MPETEDVKKEPEKTEEKIEGIKVEFFKHNPYLCEIGQPTGIHYAFLSADNKQCHQWIKCRDFLNDALRNQISNKVDEIFGFSYNPKQGPSLDLGKMQMMIKRYHSGAEKNAVERTKEIMASALAILNCIEEASGIKPPSVLHQVAGEKEMYIFEGSPEWMESTFMISLYTFLIRLGDKKLVFKDKAGLDVALKELTEKKISDHDINYLKTSLPYIDKILEKRKELTYVQKDGKHFMGESPIGMFHNYTGIVALCQNRKGQNMTGLDELVTLSKCIRESE
jgi:hypothetical protein